MEEKYKKQSIDRFEFIKQDMIDILKGDNVKTLGQLATKTRTELKNYGFEHFEINKLDFSNNLRDITNPCHTGKWKNRTLMDV